MGFRNVFLGLCTVLLLCAGTVLGQESKTGSGAGVPRLIKFSGTLRDSQGEAVAGAGNVRFTLYESQQGGEPLWSETQNLQTDGQGNYTVMLGAATYQGMAVDLFSSGNSRWLGVEVEGPGSLESPRILMVSVPYAMKAGDADTLGGQPLSAFILAKSGDAATQNAASNGSDTEVNIAAITGTGTVNVLPRWDSSGSNLVDSLIVSDPVGLVTVNAVSRLTGDLDLTRRNDLFPQASLVVDNVITKAFNFQKLGGGNIEKINFLADSLFASGNIGLGTQPSGFRLSVNGPSLLAGDLDVTRRFDNFAEASVVIDNSITKSLAFQKLGGGNVDSIKFLGTKSYFSGNVGVGTTTPSQKLDVSGTIKGTAFEGNGAAITNVAAADVTCAAACVSTTEIANAAVTSPKMGDAVRTRGITYLAGCDTCTTLADTDDQPTIYYNVVGNMNFVSVVCFADTGSPIINIQRVVGVNSPANILSGDLTCNGTATTSFALATLAKTDKLNFVMVSAAGSHRVTVAIETRTTD